MDAYANSRFSPSFLLFPSSLKKRYVGKEDTFRDTQVVGTGERQKRDSIFPWRDDIIYFAISLEHELNHSMTVQFYTSLRTSSKITISYLQNYIQMEVPAAPQLRRSLGRVVSSLG